MWCVTILLIAVATCNAEEEFKVTTVDLPATVNSRIIGGSATTIERYPFAVQVLYNSQFACGGSLLTQRHVLSAAHCFVYINGDLVSASRYTMRVGTTYLNSGGTVHNVSTITVHESYNRSTSDNDVAVILMSSSATVSASVSLALIPSQGAEVPDNSTVIAVGWGLTNVTDTAASPILNEVAIQKINLSTCQTRYMSLQNMTGIPFPVTSNMICAGILDVGGKDACKGDSGGPLIYDGVVVGITSWGIGCGEPLYPGVFTRVASFTNWIINTVSSEEPSFTTVPSVPSFTTVPSVPSFTTVPSVPSFATVPSVPSFATVPSLPSSASGTFSHFAFKVPKFDLLIRLYLLTYKIANILW